MNKVSPFEIFHATVLQNGKWLANLNISGCSFYNDIINMAVEASGAVRGLLTINVRNRSTGIIHNHMINLRA